MRLIPAGDTQTALTVPGPGKVESAIISFSNGVEFTLQIQPILTIDDVSRTFEKISTIADLGIHSQTEYPIRVVYYVNYNGHALCHALLDPNLTWGLSFTIGYDNGDDDDISVDTRLWWRRVVWE